MALVYLLKSHADSQHSQSKGLKSHPSNTAATLQSSESPNLQEMHVQIVMGLHTANNPLKTVMDPAGKNIGQESIGQKIPPKGGSSGRGHLYPFNRSINQTALIKLIIAPKGPSKSIHIIPKWSQWKP